MDYTKGQLDSSDMITQKKIAEQRDVIISLLELLDKKNEEIDQLKVDLAQSNITNLRIRRSSENVVLDNPRRRRSNILRRGKR